jgi:hypothetical protein
LGCRALYLTASPPNFIIAQPFVTFGVSVTACRFRTEPFTPPRSQGAARPPASIFARTRPILRQKLGHTGQAGGRHVSMCVCRGKRSSPL